MSVPSMTLPPPTGAAQTRAAANGNDEVVRLARENPATVANVVRSWVNA